MFPGLSSSIRIGLPSAGDPDGAAGPGNWWITGSCRPAYMWDRSDRPRTGLVSVLRSRWRGARRRRLGGEPERKRGPS